MTRTRGPGPVSSLYHLGTSYTSCSGLAAKKGFLARIRQGIFCAGVIRNAFPTPGNNKMRRRHGGLLPGCLATAEVEVEVMAGSASSSWWSSCMARQGGLILLPEIFPILDPPFSLFPRPAAGDLWKLGALHHRELDIWFTAWRHRVPRG